MINALALVCLYSNPSECIAYTSKNFYETEEQCMSERIAAEEALNDTLRGVIAYKCVEWGEPT